MGIGMELINQIRKVCVWLLTLLWSGHRPKPSKKVVVWLGTFYTSDYEPWANFLADLIQTRHRIGINQYILRNITMNTDSIDKALSQWNARIRFRVADAKYEYELPTSWSTAQGFFLEFRDAESMLEFVLTWTH